MSIERKRWAQLAQEQQFTQLGAARRQAEAWRAGLAGLTALLGAAGVLQGRQTVTPLDTPFRWVVTLLFGAALAALLAATLLAVRAAAGEPGARVLLTGEALRDWTRTEVRSVAVAIERATWLAVAGVALVAVAVGCAWLGPGRDAGPDPLSVTYGSERVCGDIVGASDGQLIVALRDGRRYQTVPLSAVTRIEQVSGC